MSAEDDMAWPAGTTVIPAEPPSPLTAEEAVEKALLYTFNWSDKQYAKMRGALTERAFIRALEQDGYTVATLDAARAPAPAGLDGLQEYADEQAEVWLQLERNIWPQGPAHGGGSGFYSMFKARLVSKLRAATRPAEAGLDAPCPRCGRLDNHLHIEPAPAGLDVERLAAAVRSEGYEIVPYRGDPDDADYLLHCQKVAEALVRAATRPAEEPGT